MSEEWVVPAIGAWGWRHDKWQDNFYPDDLPGDWQLTYYSNEFPVVLVPVADWTHLSAPQLADWIEDVNNAFRFIFELPVSEDCLDQLAKLAQCAPVFSDAMLAGVIDLSAGEPVQAELLQQLCNRGAPVLPVYVNLSAGELTPALRRGLDASVAGYCWRSDLTDFPQVNNDLQLGIISSAQERPMPLPQLRRQIEQFRSVSSTARQTVLLFRGDPPCIDDMNSAGVIADLL